jgi:hypothetical protein
MDINLLDIFAELDESPSITEKDRDKLHRLRDMIVRSVHAVDRGANKRRFAVVKRSDNMDDFGPEIVENADGTLSAVEKQLSMPGPVKAGMTRILTEAMERGASLLNMIKGAKEDADAKVPTEQITEAQAIGKLYASVGERYPSPQSKADEEDDKMTTEKVQQDEAEQKAKKAAKEEEEDKELKAKKQEEEEEEEDEMKKLEDGSIEIGNEVFTGALAEFATAFDTNVQKAGRKISGGRLKRLKDLLIGMKKLVSELDPSDFSLKDLSTALSKRMDDQTEGLRAEVAALKGIIGKMAQPETIGAGAGGAPGEAASLAKSDKKEADIMYGASLFFDQEASGDSPR